MNDMTNRRQTPRRSLDEKIHTYIQGVRVDASTLDLSAGGVFFRTEKDVPMGALIALAFRRQAQLGKPIFLVGRVARRQAEPIAGLGLQWVRAVSQAPPAELEWFLTSLLGITGVEATQEMVPGKWDMKSVYHFPEATEAAHTSAVFQSSEEAKAESDKPDFTEKPAVTAHAADENQGALTTRIGRQSSRAPASLECAIAVAGGKEMARITQLGQNSLFVATTLPRPKPATPIAVRFNIRSGSKTVPITCQCRLLTDEPGEQGEQGFDLQIERLDEGDRKGLLEKYLRWLFFQSLIGE